MTLDVNAYRVISVIGIPSRRQLKAERKLRHFLR